MALAESLQPRAEPEGLRNGKARRYSSGQPHSKRIKDSIRFNKLCRKHASQLFDEQLELATKADSEAIRASTGQYLLNRAFGMPSTSPEDQAVQLQVAAIIADLRPAIALQLQHVRPWAPVIDATPPATPALVDATEPEQDQ